MYRANRNVWPESPGLWITADGEYSFSKSGKTWTTRHRGAFTGTGILGTTRTLNDALALAGRHYYTPAGQWRGPAYRCSGDIPAGHVDCAFTCETLAEAIRHFETTSHITRHTSTASTSN